MSSHAKLNSKLDATEGISSKDVGKSIDIASVQPELVIKAKPANKPSRRDLYASFALFGGGFLFPVLWVFAPCVVARSANKRAKMVGWVSFGIFWFVAIVGFAIYSHNLHEKILDGGSEGGDISLPTNMPIPEEPTYPEDGSSSGSDEEFTYVYNNTD